ncbi:MAG: hypothetical protein AUG81_13090 [Verrucomicrobia bacterium 13_1_20CM_4_54_11]|nr:MAG: hypothetical protein AUG81_13090 [Verrucomicrobia bacterium 13_1_20CM_4_54_11]
MNRIDNSQRTAAKIAGVSGLLAVVIVMFGNYALLGPLVVPGNAAETARNIVAHQTQLRVALICFLTYGVSVVVLLSALYVILRPVDRLLALIGALFRFVFALLWLLSTLNLLGTLRLLGNTGYLQVLGAEQLQALARVTLAANFDDYYVGLPFFGLAATVCAYLWLRSGYIPKTLATFGLIASAWCVFCAFVFLIFPHFNEVVNDYWFDSPLAIFELVVSFWILFKGLKKGDDSEVDYVNAGSTKSVSLQLPVFL